MVIYYHEDDRFRNALIGASTFGAGYAQGKSVQAQQRMQQQRLDAIAEAESARRAMEEEDRNWLRQEREREVKQREADAELSRLLLGEARGLRQPTGEAAPNLGAIGLTQGPIGGLARTLSKSLRTEPSDPEQIMLDEEQRKYDAFERLAPNLSEGGRKLLFSHLATETQQKFENARYSAMARRVVGLQRSMKTTRGTEVPGLNAEDPEQGELITQLTGMLDQRADPDEINDVVAKLEGEMLRDWQALEKREDVAANMQEALTAVPRFVTQEDLDEAKLELGRFMRDESANPEDAWARFRDVLYRGKDRRREALEFAAKQTLQGYEPRMPTEDEINAAGRLMYPHDPSFVGGRTVAAIQTDVKRQKMLASEPFQGGPIGYSWKYDEGKPPAGEPFLAAPIKYEKLPPEALETTPEDDRKVHLNLTSEVMEKMGDAAEKAKTPSDVARAIERLAAEADIPADAVPDWLLDTVAQRFRASRPSEEGAAALGEFTGERGSWAPPDSAGVDAAVPESFKDGPIGYSTKFEPTPEEEVSEAVAPAVAEAGAKAAAMALTRPGKELKRWKRMSAEEQKANEKLLLAAARKATRHDFHGALAPEFRRLGIDMGSLPKDVATRLRNALKVERQRKRGGG